MKYITNALGQKPQVSGLAPDEEIERDIQKFMANCSRVTGTINQPYLGLLPQETAPFLVVLEQLLTETAENSGVKRNDVVLRRFGAAQVVVSEVEDKVLTLIPSVVLLEAKEERKPVKKVVVTLPWCKRWFLKIDSEGSQGGHQGAEIRRSTAAVIAREFA